MPNGKAGDHPLTDILNYGLPVFSHKADALIVEISRLADTHVKADLERRLVSLYPVPTGSDLVAFEDELTALRDRLRADAVERGWEVEP
jgi:hypothetical protein